MSFKIFFERRSLFGDEGGGGGGLHDKEGFSYESKEEARKSREAFEESVKACKVAQKAYEKYENTYYGHESSEEIKRAWEQYEIEYGRYLKIYSDTAEHYGHKRHKKRDRLH